MEKHSPQIVVTLIGLIIFTALLPLPVKAQKAIRIVFPRESYCGSYSGDFQGGREFVLGLAGGQAFTSRNTGGGTQWDVYVYGPTGRLFGHKVAINQIKYQIPRTGDYYIQIESNSKFGSVEFCAY